MGGRKFGNDKDIYTSVSSVPEIVTTHEGLKVWIKIFGNPSAKNVEITVPVLK